MNELFALMSTPGEWMGLLMEAARCVAHDTAVFDGSISCT